MTKNGAEFRLKLRRFGLSSAAIDAAWPDWWSEAAEASPSAAAELRFSLARKLGLDPRSLLDEDEQPRFVWHDEVAFKHLRTESEWEKAALGSFGVSVARLLLQAIPPSDAKLRGLQAADVRRGFAQNRAGHRCS